jgi:glycosyltransferase involved in cell wall biosynthesis
MLKNIFVSVLCPTYNRQKYLISLIDIFNSQIYPKELLELIILDDSDNPYEIPNILNMDRVNYIYEKNRMTIGQKRNKLNELAKGDIILCMDDDDYYPETRVSHAVERLQNSDLLIASCPSIYVYSVLLDRVNIMKCGMKNLVRNATVAYKKEYLLNHKYNDTDILGEEGSFTNNYSEPVLILDTLLSIIVINHGKNTVKYEFFKNSIVKKKINELIGDKILFNNLINIAKY